MSARRHSRFCAQEEGGCKRRSSAGKERSLARLGMTKSRKSTGGHAREIVSIQLSVISLGEENPARPGRAEAVQVSAREKDRSRLLRLPE
jgi:hypothetical protein